MDVNEVRKYEKKIKIRIKSTQPTDTATRTLRTIPTYIYIEYRKYPRRRDWSCSMEWNG